MDALISFIIPVYNVESYLARCLDSVINNTYRNLEIICVNDGSPDNCQAILEDYAAKDSRIKIFWQRNQGVSVARNVGIEHASGEWLYFADPDDWVHHESFGFLMKASLGYEADVVYGGFKEVYKLEDLDPAEEIEYPDIIRTMTVTELLNGAGHFHDGVWGKLFRRTVVAEHRFPAGIKFAEDAYFSHLIAASRHDLRYVFVDVPLYGYYMRTNSMMHTLTENERFEIIKRWTSDLDKFITPQYAVANIIQKLFFYRYSAKYTANPEVARRNTRKTLRCCFPYLRECLKLSNRKKLKMLLGTCFPSLYYQILTYRDPTYKVAEKLSAERNKNVVLKEWDEI